MTHDSGLDSLRLMCIFAHPDDESLGAGSTLASYAAEGVEITLITATRGQRGWSGDPHDNPGPDALGALREQELRAAAETLGIRYLYLLDYMDGDLNQADPFHLSGELATHIRRHRPQVVITFGPDGAYGHPDHIAISQCTAAAIVRAAGRDGEDDAWHVAKLYYMVESQPLIDIYESLVGPIAMVIDGVERRAFAWPDWMITTVIDGSDHWQTAWRAVQCHRSQLPYFDRLTGLSEVRQRELWGVRTYYRAMSLVNGGREVEDDLFAGLRWSQP
jgi:LmbE family N-acetylglucosaminyl deacetylase